MAGTIDPVRANVLGLALIVGAGYLFQAAEPELSTADAIYMSTMTFTTIGYGDIAPTTKNGRLLMIVMSLLGVGFFGSVLIPMWGRLREKQLDGRLLGGMSLSPQMVSLMMLAANIIVGAGLCNYLESDKMLPKVTDSASLVDAAYFSIVTGTTVGYGDYYPTTDAGKLLISLYAFLCLQVTASFADSVGDWLHGLCIADGSKSDE